MFEKAKPARDAFKFSLGGIRATAPVVAAPIIADDRINKVLDERMNQARVDHYQQPNLWLNVFRQTAYGVCAYQELMWRFQRAAFRINESALYRHPCQRPHYST